jgi:hypothetical protein
VIVVFTSRVSARRPGKSVSMPQFHLKIRHAIRRTPHAPREEMHHAERDEYSDAHIKKLCSTSGAAGP